MRALDRKLIRDLRRIWAQCLSIALVLGCGVMVLVLADGAQRSLSETRAAYYDRARFADIFASATRAPRSLLDEIAALEGVMQVEGRIVLPATLDIPGLAEPASAQMLSLPLSGAPALNLPLLRSGRMPDPLRPDEVAVAEPFAAVNGLRNGDQLRVVLKGRQRDLVIAGQVLSPEFIYTIAPAAMMPDDQRYGLIWMGEEALAAAADLDGAFNDLALTLARDTAEPPVIAALDRFLAPYGGTGAHGRDRQTSHAFLENELVQLRAMALWLPPVFLFVAAFLVNMVLARLILLERQQIGLLKAVGYSTTTIAAHYLKMVAGIGALGVVVGWAAGSWLGHAMTGLYGEYFRFPFLLYAPGTSAYIISGSLGMATVMLGAARAVLTSARLAPAVAMSPPAPPSYNRGWVDALGRAAHLRQTTMMILRSLTRWPGRAAVTLFGVMASVAVLVASFFTFDVVDLLMADVFDRSNRQDVTLMLDSPRNAIAVQDALRLPGVVQAEGAMMLPVRVSHLAQSRLLTLQARAPATELSRVLDAEGRAVELPTTGLAIPQSLADTLQVGPGALLTVELLAPPRETWQVPVGAVIRQSMGQDIHMRSDALFARMRQPPQVNVIHMRVDPASLPELHAALKQVPAVAGTTLWPEVRRQFEATVNTSMLTSAAIYTALGMLIVLGVIYNAARIQLSERSHELASLRVLGFTRWEVGYVLVGEMMLLALLGVPLGWAAGYAFAWLISTGLSSDLFSFPMVIGRRTWALSGAVVLATALAAALMVRRRLDHVDLVSALKKRE